MSEEIKVGTSEVESGVIACGKYLIYPGKTWDGKPMVWIDKEDGEAMGLDEKSLDEIWKDRF